MIQRPLLSISGKLNLKRSDKHVALLNLSIYCTWKKNEKVIKKQEI